MDDRTRDDLDAAPTTTAHAQTPTKPPSADAGQTYRFPRIIFPSAPTPEQAAQAFESGPVRIVLPGESAVRSASRCDELLALPLSEETDTVPSNELERIGLWSTMVDCAASRMVALATGATDSHVTELLTSDDPADLLPPQLGLVDFDNVRAAAGGAAARCRSWRAFDKHIRLERDAELARFKIVSADWRGWLYLLARGDFDGDGFEDVLVRRDGKANEGSWSATAFFLLSRTERDRCIRVVQTMGLS